MIQMSTIEKYTEDLLLGFIPVTEKNNIKGVLQENSRILIEKSRIPAVLNLNKKYATFTYDLSKEFPKETFLILIKHQENRENSLLLKLNYAYFTYSEIFKAFNIPQISSFQQIGHIVHINLLKIHEPFKYIIGKVILDKLEFVKTVITKTNDVGGVFRVFNYEILAGEDNLETVHIENNIKFFIDYRNVYWNGKLSEERLSLVIKNKKPNSIIADCTCGVGALSLLALKNGYKVYSNDLNPKAIECLSKSLKLNPKLDKTKILTYNKDCYDFINMLIDENIYIDHFVFNLPEKSLDLLEPLQRNTKKYTIHAYFFCKDRESCYDFVKKKVWFKFEESDIKYIRNVSPNKIMYKITKTIDKKE